MARLTNNEYLLRRKFLIDLWEHDKTQRVFSYMDINKQRVLHIYFATSKFDWTDTEALDYRKTRTNNEAFSAGKAFNELRRIITGQKIVGTESRVYPLMRQEINVKGLAEALVMNVKNMKK